MGPTPFQPFVAVQMILIKYMVRGIHIYKQQFGNIPSENRKEPPAMGSSFSKVLRRNMQLGSRAYVWIVRNKATKANIKSKKNK
jgi:hypothetical protein